MSINSMWLASYDHTRMKGVNGETKILETNP